ILPIEVVIGIFFALIALMFVGLGQKMGRAFNALPDRVGAYSVNILGSLVGIAAFGLASYLRTPPVVWFGLGLAGVFALDRRLTFLKLLGLIGVPALLVLMERPENPEARTIWSPYYKVQYEDRSTDVTQLIHVNNITH